MAELKQFQDLPGNVADGDDSSVKQTFADFQSRGEDYVRQFPTQSVLYAVGAGFLLRILPLAALLRVLLRLALSALKPALLIYGAVTLYKHYQAPSDQS